MQADIVCDTLSGDGLESDAVDAITDVAAVPVPPLRPTLLLLSGCTALVTATPPDDFGGTDVTGMTIGVFLSTGVLHESFGVTLYPGAITVRNLLAYTSYYVKAALNTTIGDSGFGEPLTFTTEDPSLPEKLSLLEVADVGSSSVVVNWQGPANTGGGAISGYLLYQRAIVSTAIQELVYNGSSDSSKTSFLVGKLLATTTYMFTVVPVNQYGLEGVDDGNVINATTLAAEIPFPPTSVMQYRIDGGYVDLSFTEPFYTGGFAVTSLQYSARIQSLFSCLEESSCSTCSHSLDPNGAFQLLDAATNSCTATACGGGGNCCLNDGATCGIIVTETKACSALAQFRICRIEGLHFATTYSIAVSATNIVGESPYSNSILVTTSEARRPGVPQLHRVSASGGSITLKWTLPADTGGASIVRMSLSVNGNELFDTDSALTYTDCGNLQKSTDYTYTIEVENEAGFVNQATSSFTTTAATAPELVTLSEFYVGMQTAKFLVSLPCDNGGAPGDLTLSYRVVQVGDTSEFIEGRGTCCSIQVNNLEASTNYQVKVRAESSALSGDWETMDFMTLSGIPSSPNTTFLYATQTALQLALIPPSSTGGSSLSLEVIAASVATEATVFHDSLNCPMVDLAYNCPATLTVGGINASQDGFTYMVSTRAVGTGGSSSWINQSYDVDDGRSGSIGFVDTINRGVEGETIDVNVLRVFGTTTLDQTNFQISSGTIASNWSCSPTSSGAICSADNEGSNAGYISFESGEYLKTISFTFDDSQYESEAVSLHLALVSTTTSSLSNTLCEVIFDDNGDAGILTFEHSQMTVMENVGTMDIVIMRTGGVSGQVSVTLISTMSSSIGGNQLREVVEFVDGIGRAVVTTGIRDSDQYETRRFVVRLLNPTDGATVTGNTLTVVVQDKGDMSLPGRPRLLLGLITGGCFELLMQPPNFTGGSTTDSFLYTVNVFGSNDSFHASYTTIANSINMCDLEHDKTYVANATFNNGYGDGESSSITILTGGISAPSQVTQLLVDSITSGYANLSWKSSLDKGGLPLKCYEVTILTESTQEKRLIEVPSSEISLSISFLAAATWYSFSVHGVNEGGLIGSDSTVRVSTGSIAVSPQQPPPPKLLSATGGALYVGILAPIDCGGSALTYYTLNIARHIQGNSNYRQYAYESVQSLSYDGSVANVSIYGLLSNTEYLVTVSVSNVQGWSPPSKEKGYFTTGPTAVGKMAAPVVALEDPGEITLEWSTPLDSGGLGIVGYKVQARHLFANGSWSLPEVVYDNRTSLAQTTLISNIVANTDYAFSVIAYNFRTLCHPDEDITPSDELRITTQDASVPSQPKNLRTLQVTGGAVTLAWDPPRSSGGEMLRWYLLKGGAENSEVQVLANVSATAPTSLTLYGFTASTSYVFAVAGENSRGYGLYSASLYVTTSSTSAPGPPKLLRQISASSGGTILLAWEAPDDSGGAEVQQYNILRDNISISIALAVDGTTTFRDQNNILADTNYRYSVFASNDVVSGTNEATFMARSSVATVAADPSATIQSGGGFLMLSLTASPDTGGVPFLRFELAILRGTAIVDKFNISGAVFTVNGLYADVQYSILIQTVNAVGKSESRMVIATTTAATAPDKMSAPRLVEITGGRIRFGVTLPVNFGGNDIVDYQFYVNGTQSDMVEISDTEYDLVSLTALTFYSVTVSAINDIGKSEQSDPLIVTTSNVTPPGVVWDLSAISKTYENIELTWMLPQDTGGDIAAVEYDIEFNSSADNISHASSDTNGLTLTALDPSTLYTIQVRAINLAGEGPWSSMLTVTTDPVSPGVINFESREVKVSEGDASISLTLLRTMGGFMPAKCIYTTQDGTALAGTQYTHSSGEIDFERSSKSEQIVIEIISNDVTDDPDKYFSVSIQQYDDDSGAIGDISTVKVIIVDDGDAGILAFGQNRYSVSESVPTLSLIIVRKLKFSGNSTIAIDIVDTPDDATEGVDYVIPHKTAVFADQQKEVSVDVTILNDSTYQAQKLFNLKLRVVSGRIGISDSGATTTIEIVDDGDTSPPGLPTAVQVIAISGGTVKVSWVAPEYLGAKNVTTLLYTAHIVEVQSGATRDHSVKAFSSIIGQLKARTAYEISIAASNNYFVGAYTLPVSILMGAATRPSKPRDVQVLSLTGGMATLSWKPPLNFGGADISSYRVNVSTSSDMNFVGTYTSNSSAASTNNLSPLTSYSATVEAIHKEGLVGEASIAVVFKTTAASIPGKPTSLDIAKVTGGALLVSMAPSLDLGGTPILSYTLLMTSAQYPTVFRQVYQGPTASFYATRLTFSTTYKLQYKVSNTVGTSELSDVVTTTTKYMSLPDEAQNLVALSRTGGSVTLSWLPPVDFGGADVTAYDVSFFLGDQVKAQFQQRVSGITTNSTSITAKIVGLLANSIYGFSVSGVNDVSVCADPSAMLTRQIVYTSTNPLVTLPDTPSGLAVISSTSGMQTIRWSASEDTGGDSFVAYLLYSNAGEVLYNGTITVFTRGYLTKNTAYSYSVCAWNTAGTSLKSSPVVASTKSNIVAPSQPLLLSQTSSTGGSIGLVWQMPVDNGGDSILGYKLYRNGAWRADIGAEGNTLIYLDDHGLAASQQYTYVVQATNSIGLGALSANLDATTSQATVPMSPTQLVVGAIGGNLTAAWVPAEDSGGLPLVFFRLDVLIGSSIAFSTTIATSQTSYTLFGRRANMSYTVVVTSGNSIGESSTKQIVSNGVAVRPAAPLAPERNNDTTGLQAWMIVLKLYLPIDDGGAPIDQLYLYQNGSKTRSISVSESNQAVLGDSTTRYILVEIGPLHADATYYFAVSALSSVAIIGEGLRSDAVKVRMDPATLPSTPMNLGVTLRTAFSVFLQWDASVDTGGDEVIYEIAYTNANTSESGNTQVNTTTIEIPKLIPGDVYMFRVRAQNSAGTSMWSPDLSAETDVTQRGVIAFNVGSLTVFENVTSVTVQLLRVNGSSSTISCRYTIGAGTATYGRDYTLPPEPSRSFSFVGELTVQSFDVQIINNDVYEPIPRTVILTLTDTTPERSDPFPPALLTITIVDDGDAGMIGFVDSEVTVMENARILPLQLRRLYGKSTATSARIILFSGLASTTQPDIGFRLPLSTVDFIDGQTSSSASIVIKDNDVYDFPYLYFYLTIEIAAGAAKIGTYSVIKVVVLDDGDRSVPGAMKAPSLDRATGGMLQLKWEPPVNVGGQNISITGYNISIRTASTTRWLLTQTSNTLQALGGLNPLTTYNFTISAINPIGRGSDSNSVSFDTTNFTAPGPTAQISLVNKTGGLLTVSIVTPVDIGGAPITGYLLYLALAGGDFKLAYNGTGQPSSVIPVSVNKADTAYSIRAQVINFIGTGDMSELFNFTSGPLSRSGPPGLPATYSSRTGGAISLLLQPPIDTGGHENMTYMIYYREQGSGKRFRLAYYLAEKLEMTIFRLAADTAYDMVGISILDSDTNALTLGNISVSDSNIRLSDLVTDELTKSEYFDFGGYIFQVDSTITPSNSTINYLPSFSSGDGEIASTDLENGDVYSVFVRGAFSAVSTFTTSSPTRPGIPTGATLDYSTGGALHVRISWPNDTGGVLITGYTFYIDNKTVDGELYRYESHGDFDLEVTVEIGGLSPETNYSFYYIPLNDVSACPGVDNGLPDQCIFQTDVASQPTLIQLIQSTGATGGGIHVEIKAPIDRGSDQELYYQVYMSPSQLIPIWTLVYNSTDVSYWQTDLQKATEYLFMASCMNEVGYSGNSSIYPLRTTLISPPGPPSDLKLKNATGGMVTFSWKSPDDDGGSVITYYVVNGQTTSDSVVMVEYATTVEINFGGLLANKTYEFKVYAGNSLGTGSDAGVKMFSTTRPTLPSLPGTPIVLKSSGGAATLSIQVPKDTGGVTVNDLVWNVYANGVKLPADAVRRLQTAPAIAITPNSRRLTRRELAEGDGSLIYVQAGGLLPSTTYSFTIQASNDVGVSAVTNEATTVTSVPTVPEAPEPPLATSITGGAIGVSWSDPVDTGGIPLTGYRLSMTRLGTEVGSCEGMILSCTIGNLLSITDYEVTLVAYNHVGASPSSEITTFTTAKTSLPRAPQDVHIADVSNTFASIHWSPCIDFGGGYIETYQVDIVQTSDTSVTFSTRVPVTQENATIISLSPLTDYTVTVRAVTGDNQLGEASKIIFFRTPRYADQPPPPAVGCHSRKVAIVFWESEDDAVSYILYRNGESYHDNGEDITFEDDIVMGATYSYQVQVKRLDGSISVLSEATTFVATTPASRGFDCLGSKGHIHWHEYKNLDQEMWTIIPQNQAGLTITFSMFWLECDHDQLTIEVTSNGTTKQLWKGGCRREGDFVISTAPGLDSVILSFTSDESITYEGMALYYESVDPSDAVESVDTPCPLSSNGYCSLNGACRKGICSCFTGYVGESCTNAVICPKDPTTCTISTCDPVCFQTQNDVIVVSVNGDDTQGTGQRMDTSPTGTDPKAVKTLQRALQLALPEQTILLYPGVYTGTNNCGLTVATNSLLIRGLRGQIVTTFDCGNLFQGLIITSGPIRLVGFTLQNAVTNTDGAAVSVVSASVEMENIVFTNGYSRQSGGAIYAYQSQLILTNSELSNCSALLRGGAIMLDESILSMYHSTIKLSAAKQGGGIFAQNSVTVSGDTDSTILNNTATLNGGGICAAGTFRGSMLHILQNSAPVGAGIAVISGNSIVSNVSIVENYGLSDGGGIALLNTANLVLQNSPTLSNSADRYGGGIYMDSNGTFENVASEISNCTAAIGGGFYAADWTLPIVTSLRIRSSSATMSGGCAAFSSSSAILNNADLEGCDAPIGGGVYAAMGSKLSLLYASITGCTAVSGAGMYIDSSSVVGANDISSMIRDNQANDTAGGVFITGSQSSFQYFDVTNCDASLGGGIFAQMASEATINSVKVLENKATENGGGLYIQSSMIKVINVASTDNIAVTGGGVYVIDSSVSGLMSVNRNSGEQGGGVATFGTNTLEGVTMTSNTAKQRGGGLAVETGTLTLKSATIQSCSVLQGVGGGISIMNATVKHYAVVVQSCSSLRGGGIYANASEFYQHPTDESTVMSQNAASLTQNTADEYGGSIFIDGEGTFIRDIIVTSSNATFGGGVAALNVQGCIVVNAKISYSTAMKSGGGFFFGSGTNCVLRDSWTTNNEAVQSGGGLMVQEATIYHSNVKIANNVAPTAGGVYLNSELLPAALLWWDAAETQRSRIDANIVDPIGSNGANVLLTCTSNCNISGCIISGANLQVGQGAGVFIVGRGNATISNSLITNNSAARGGGIAVSDADLTILENVSVVGNYASDRGGGLWAEKLEFYPEVKLHSCVFYNNSAKSYGGAISLAGVYACISTLLVVENHAGNSENGVGGGLYADSHATVISNSSLFLSNDATVGGSIATVKSSDITFREGFITRDSDRFFTDTWQDLFLYLVGFEYVKGRAENLVDVQKGDLIYLSDTDSSVEVDSSFVTYGTADAGGGIYINANAYFYSKDSEISSNTAQARGGSVCASNSAQVYFISVKVILSESKTSGGGIFVDTSSKVYAENSDISDNFADDSGGGVYLDTGDKNAVTLNGSSVERNIAHGEGCGVFVGREAVFAGYKSHFVGNGRMTPSGKNEGGGAISAIDGVVKLTSCTLVNNTAVVGGAIHVDRSGSVAIMSSLFTGNTADQSGGAIAAGTKAKVTIALLTSFENNTAYIGGAVAVDGISTSTLTSVVFLHNQASGDGGALYVTDQATLTLRNGEMTSNSATLGGAFYADGHSTVSVKNTKFITNVAFTRGGALYYQSIDNTTTSGITCKGNTAPSGGCMFWVSNDEDLMPKYPCSSCMMESNEVYDIATNTRDVHLMWWPDNITSGVTILEFPDEESIEVLETRNKTLESTTYVWPRLKAVDLYGQVEVLDNQTECYISDGLCNEQRERLFFEPRSGVRAAVGVISFREGSFTAANRTPEEGIYTTNVSCTLLGSEPRAFVQNVMLLPCQPGFSINQGVCERCPKQTYSLDGVKCFDCPSGANCNMSVRRATETIALELGTTYPRTQEGYYLFSAPASKQESNCLKPSRWKSEDPCKKVALRNSTANLADVINECSNLIDFNVYWPPDRLYSCLSGTTFYTCDVEDACHADVSLQTIELSSSVDNVSCASGYGLTICSVCADGFKRATDNSCLPCNKANAQVRASVRWQNFVIPVLLIFALVAGVYGVRIYLRDLTEIGLLAKAEADRRLKDPTKKGEHFAVRTNMAYRRQSMEMAEQVVQGKDKITAFFKKYQSRNAKMVFGVDASPPTRTFPVTPSKFKIFIGFFQIFGNFQSSFVVKWSTGVQNIMNFSQKFNLDLVAIAGIDCVVTKNFYFDFTVTVVLVVFALTVITAYFYAGMRSYRAKLQLIPRNCLRCGLPVLEGEVIQNDDESFNPLRLLRSWWRTRNFYKYHPSARQVEERKGISENASSIALSTIKEARSLKRKFGMSQVRTPYLGLFRSVHTKCPAKRHVLSGSILQRTIRSNLRVWQARVKLRMNYLTYRNKCLKLYCWMALFLYPSVSKTILTVYNCQEVGDVYYLVVDRRLICYNGQWAIFGLIATIGLIVWVVGIPFFFGLLIWLAQDRGVAARISILRKPQMRTQLQKWIKEVEEQQRADGRYVRNMDNEEVQMEELAKYMKRKNLKDSTVQSRLGFIYAEYTDDYWWFEVVDLSRKLFLSGVIVFVENGSVEQVLLAIGVCLMTMWFLLYFQPYDGYTDNLIASITQLQLYFTLWLGVMIRLNDLNVESLINVQLLSYLLVGTCVAVTIFGFAMIVGEGLTESRRIYTEEVAVRKKKLQDEIRKRWFMAFNYAVYEAQVLRFGSRLNFTNFSVSAIIGACYRAKAIEEQDGVTTLPKFEDENVELSPTDLRHPDTSTQIRASTKLKSNR